MQKVKKNICFNNIAGAALFFFCSQLVQRKDFSEQIEHKNSYTTYRTLLVRPSTFSRKVLPVKVRTVTIKIFQGKHIVNFTTHFFFLLYTLQICVYNFKTKQFRQNLNRLTCIKDKVLKLYTAIALKTAFLLHLSSFIIYIHKSNRIIHRHWVTLKFSSTRHYHTTREWFIYITHHVYNNARLHSNFSPKSRNFNDPTLYGAIAVVLVVVVLYFASQFVQPLTLSRQFGTIALN